MTATIQAQLAARNGGAAVFDGVRIDGQLRGLLLEVSVLQSFRNPGAAHIELVYTFPLPAQAVLLSMDVRLGERSLAASVVERRQASRRYEDALAEGDSAVMLERAADGSYCINLGNLGPGETGEIVLRYAQALRFAQRGLRLCIPTVIAPRYGNPLRDAGLAPHQVPTHDLLGHYPFVLALKLASEFAGATIGSPSHTISIAPGSEGRTVALNGDAALDRDFVLTLDGLAQDCAAIAAADPVEPGRTAVLAGFCPRVPASAPRPLRTKILVDCSGSMAGDSIAASRRALQAVIAGFGKDDRFSLSRFGSSVEHRSRALWKSTERTRISARRWVGNLAADLGGTEMAAALASTFALDQARASDVLLVTDGHIHAIDEVTAAACASGHRLFIVAIGSSPSESQLRQLAQASGGAIDFVAPGEAVEPAIGRMFARLRSPRLDALRLDWPGSRTPCSATLPAVVFEGDTVHVYAALDGAVPDGEVRLYGRDAAGIEHEIGAAPIRTAADGGTLARMAVQAQLQDDATLGPFDRRRLACAYELVTADTNFLLTVERAPGEKAGGMPRLHQVAQMLPAGYGGIGSVTPGSDNVLRQPTVWRRESTSDAIDAAMRQHAAPPMFRRAAPDERYSMPDTRPAPSLVQRMVWFWQWEPGSACLTPLALHRMLVSTPAALWDRSYDDLLAAKIDPSIVEWLRTCFGAAWREEVIVASFLACMAQPRMRRTMGGASATLLGWMRPAPSRPLPAQADSALIARMMQALAGIRADTWPPLPAVTREDGATALPARDDARTAA